MADLSSSPSTKAMNSSKSTTPLPDLSGHNMYGKVRDVLHTVQALAASCLEVAFQAESS